MYGGLTTHLYKITVIQFRYPAIQLSKNKTFKLKVRKSVKTN